MKPECELIETLHFWDFKIQTKIVWVAVHPPPPHGGGCAAPRTIFLVILKLKKRRVSINQNFFNVAKTAIAVTKSTVGNIICLAYAFMHFYCGKNNLQPETVTVGGLNRPPAG